MIGLAITHNGTQDDRLLQLMLWFMRPLQFLWLGLLLLECAMARLRLMALGVVVWCAALLWLSNTEFWPRWWSFGS